MRSAAMRKILELAPRNLDAINTAVTPREICAGCRGQYRSMWRRWCAQQHRGANSSALPGRTEGVGERLGLQVRERMLTATAGRGDDPPTPSSSAAQSTDR